MGYMDEAFPDVGQLTRWNYAGAYLKAQAQQLHSYDDSDHPCTDLVSNYVFNTTE